MCTLKPSKNLSKHLFAFSFIIIANSVNIADFIKKYKTIHLISYFFTAFCLKEH